jgi:hypothetical protein
MECINKEDIVQHLDKKQSDNKFTALLEYFEPVTEASDNGKQVDIGNIPGLCKSL